MKSLHTLAGVISFQVSFLCLSLFSLASHAETVDTLSIQLPVKVSIRAIICKSVSEMWFGANRGVWGYTSDGGLSWHIDSIRVDTNLYDFRSIAVLNDSTVILINAGSPARIFRTTDRGKTWTIVFSDDDPAAFFDSMKFINDRFGYALADPVNGCFRFYRTTDAGITWQLVDCHRWLHALEGEACFAASNSCIEAIDNHVWFVTGGSHSRIFISDDFGNNWKVHPLPVKQGEQMTGAFTVSFYDKNFGMAMGGHYEHQDQSDSTKAYTTDGGQTWNLLQVNLPGFVSSVKFFPESGGKKMLIGGNGIFMTNNKGKSFTRLSVLSCNAISISPDATAAWAAGNKGQLVRMIFKK